MKIKLTSYIKIFLCFIIWLAIGAWFVDKYPTTNYGSILWFLSGLIVTIFYIFKVMKEKTIEDNQTKLQEVKK